MVIGLAGIVVGLCWYVGYRNRRQFTLQEEEQQYLASEEAARPALKFSEWLALFKRRTTWGMILGFSGVNYTGWLYIAWLPGYLQAQQGLSLWPVPAGWRRSRFLPRRWGCGSTAGGRCPGAQRLRSGENPQNGDCYRSGAVGAGHLAGGAIVDASPGGGFYLHGAVLRSFCRDVRRGLVQVMVAEHKVASVAAIQNFGSFVFASFAPIVTGWVVDTTHSFNLALVIAAGVTFAGALCYFFIVKTRID